MVRRYQLPTWWTVLMILYIMCVLTLVVSLVIAIQDAPGLGTLVGQFIGDVKEGMEK